MKLWKAAVSFAMYVYPSVHPQGTIWLATDGFPLKFFFIADNYWNPSRKSRCIQIGQNNSHFTWRTKNVHNNILVNSLVNERITLKKLQKNSKCFHIIIPLPSSPPPPQSFHLRNIIRQSQEGRNIIWHKKIILACWVTKAKIQPWIITSNCSHLKMWKLLCLYRLRMCVSIVHKILFKSQKLKILRRDEMSSLLVANELNTTKPSEI